MACEVVIYFLCAFVEALSEVLKKNGDLADCNKQVVSVTHEVIANDNDSFAYERGHYLNYSKDGGVIISGGE